MNNIHKLLQCIYTAYRLMYLYISSKGACICSSKGFNINRHDYFFNGINIFPKRIESKTVLHLFAKVYSASLEEKVLERSYSQIQEGNILKTQMCTKYCVPTLQQALPSGGSPLPAWRNGMILSRLEKDLGSDSQCVES